MYCNEALQVRYTHILYKVSTHAFWRKYDTDTQNPDSKKTRETKSQKRDYSKFWETEIHKNNFLAKHHQTFNNFQQNGLDLRHTVQYANF